MYKQQSLRNLFLRTNGLIRIRPKVRVTDNYTLSLVYTPGVGHICKVIESDPDQLYELTITNNSIALLSDGSKFNLAKPQKIIPNLEAISALYKAFYDINAYPIVLNRNIMPDISDYMLVIDNLSPTYKTIVLIDIEKSLANQIISAVERTKMDCSVIISNSDDLREQLYDAALIKATLDCRSILKPSQLEIVRKAIIQIEFKRLPNNLTDTLNSAYAEGILEIYKNKWYHHTIRNIEPVQFIKQLNDLYIYGDIAQYNKWSDGHLLQKNDFYQNALELHKRYNGMITIELKFNTRSLEDLFKIYESSYRRDELGQLRQMLIDDSNKLREITFQKNYAAIITNGTAILGLGNIGPAAGSPVMEGKSVLFSALGGIDLMPICLKEKDPQKLVKIIRFIAPIFSAINLEDLRAPDCFPIEEEAVHNLHIPLMHDDQHGTAVVSLAAVINYIKLTKKNIKDLKLVINGAGAAGVAICKLLHGHGIQDIIICDTTGIIYEGRPSNMNEFKNELASFTNKNKIKGVLTDAVKGRDLFVGVSTAGALTKEMIKSMNKNPFILALANPVPEIMPDEAIEAGAFIIATGRSDFNNQVNNSLAFPGIFRGAIDTRAREINLEMKIAAAYAIANSIKDSDLCSTRILPSALTADIPANVAKAVAIAAMQTGVAKINIDPEKVFDQARKLIMEGNMPSL
ncbi:unnamed protein product [Paramecium primaurelia]|uniref:Malic enzyme n=1 Tax=Paramecium primaurelia TaxID=5886 RepID=A0A8S1NIK3_PARPR|nr:unnamed protein product [Paramecium primaurelia]